MIASNSRKYKNKKITKSNYKEIKSKKMSRRQIGANIKKKQNNT